jgi:hypothetical protein
MSPLHGARRSKDIEGCCEYIEFAAADSPQGVVLQLGDLSVANNYSPYKTIILRNVTLGNELM